MKDACRSSMELKEFDEFKGQIHSRWVHRLLVGCWVSALVVALTELGILASYMLSDTMSRTVASYLLLRFAIPSGINVISCIIATYIYRSKVFPLQAEIYVSVFALFIISSVVSIMHNYFMFFMAALSLPLFGAMVFGDRKMIRFVFGCSFITIACSAYTLTKNTNYDTIIYFASLTGLVVYQILCYLFAWSMTLTQQKQMEYVFSSYRRQLELVHELRIDPLTHLYNRVALSGAIRNYIMQAEKRQIAPFLVFFELDSFSMVSARYGAVAADEVLVQFANVLKAQLDGIRHAFRFGGARFCILFDTDSIEDIQEIIGNIRINFRNVHFSFSPKELFSFTTGIAPWEHGFDEPDWLFRAESALHVASQSGENKVVMHSHSENIPLVNPLYDRSL